MNLDSSISFSRFEYMSQDELLANPRGLYNSHNC
jgi:hypothetical protein